MTWVAVILSFVSALATLLVGLALRAFKAGQWTIAVDPTPRLSVLDSRVANIEARLESGNGKMSELAGMVNAMPDRMRIIFVDKQVFEVWITESREDRMEIRKAYEKADEDLHKEINNMWSELRRRGSQRG